MRHIPKKTNIERGQKLCVRYDPLTNALDLLFAPWWSIPSFLALCSKALTSLQQGLQLTEDVTTAFEQHLRVILLALTRLVIVNSLSYLLQHQLEACHLLGKSSEVIEGISTATPNCYEPAVCI